MEAVLKLCTREAERIEDESDSGKVCRILFRVKRAVEAVYEQVACSGDNVYVWTHYT